MLFPDNKRWPSLAQAVLNIHNTFYRSIKSGTQITLANKKKVIPGSVLETLAVSVNQKLLAGATELLGWG